MFIEEERFVPQLLEKSQGYSVKKLYSNLINERENSNKLYALGKGTNKSFLQDYFKIKSLMNRRNASNEQFFQLKKVFESYVRYINLNKYHTKKLKSIKGNIILNQKKVRFKIDNFKKKINLIKIIY